MSKRRTTLALGVAFGITGILMAVGCGVPQSKYDTTANKLKRAERDLTLAEDEHNKTKQQLTTTDLQVKDMRSRLQSVQQQAAEMKARVASLEAKLRACKALSAASAAPAAPAAPATPPRPADPPPPPSAGAASATGGLDLAAVQAGVTKLMPKIKRCYQKRVLSKGKKLTGTLIVKFRINKRGKTRRVKVRKGTIKHRRLQKCVRRVFRRARFKRSKKTTKVSYPLRFAP